MKTTFLISLILVSTYFISCTNNNNSRNHTPLIKNNTKLNLTPATGYPRWLKDNNTTTDQTSGITFIEERGPIKIFLLADDTGTIYRFEINNDTLFTLIPYQITGEAAAFIKTLTKPDFEEITYDKHTGKVYLSIEGNGSNFKQEVGIYEIIFQDNDKWNGNITRFNKLKIEPEHDFLQYTAPNIGFEGLAVDKNYFYIGLEGFTEKEMFADSTILYIVNKNTLQIENIISTRSVGIHTICGLHSPAEKEIIGIDRNSRKIFYTSFDNSLNFDQVVSVEISPEIPRYNHLGYVAALESITMDNTGAVYLTDDPWRRFYIPDTEILNQLDDNTVRNFKQFIPVIYKFKSGD